MRKGITSAKKNVAEFVQTLINNGLRNVVVSPGSRNAPLVIACDEHPDMTCHLIHDERSAGFVALGMALQADKPVAVICTSGSAVANYLPAVVEAYYQEIPLVVISADRPAEWINHGDGQTIMQEGIFGKHIQSEISLNDQQELDVEGINHILSKCWSDAAGPIHFNFSFEEPLYETKPCEFPSTSTALKTIIENGQIPKPFIEAWGRSERKMILVGQNPPDENLQNQLSILANDPSVIVLTENTANVTNRNFISCIDRTIEGLRGEDDDFVPEILLTIGGAIVSKKIKKLIRSWPIQMHYRIAFSFPEMDTFRHLTGLIQSKPSSVLKTLNEYVSPNETSNFQARWKGRDYLHEQKLEQYLSTQNFGDFTVFHQILEHVPDFVHLHLGNSSVVRYSQLFNPFPLVRYSCNRGTSGIDGSLSTAIGAAMAEPQTMHLCVLGDISFLYDSNGLWNLNFPSNFRLIIINNGGGGIFKIIPGPSSVNQVEDYFFATNQKVQLNNLLNVFGLSSLEVKYFSTLNEGLEKLLEPSRQDGVQSLVIDTIEGNNEECLKGFFSIL